MDIQRLQGNIKSPLPNVKDRKAEKNPFSEMMQTEQAKTFNRQMGIMLEQLDQQGRRLMEHQTIPELKEYKRLVREIITELKDHGLNLHEERSFGSDGRLKTHQLIEKIDKKLVEMTDQMLQQEQKPLSLLDMAGEIKGMIIHLYG